MTITGILLVSKPVGITSFLVVSKVRRLFGLRRVGHCGTLDPFAEGLLPIVVGRATRAVSYMDSYDKTYQVRIRFGRTTDTLDHTGTTRDAVPLSDESLESLKQADFAPVRSAIQSLTEIVEQVPPMYSAVKIDGRPLYDYARAGQEIERKSRPVSIDLARPLAIAIDENGLYADALIHCSKGTYIRSLAEDVGRITGLLAHAEALTRLQTGPFQLADAHSWTEITDAIEAGTTLPLLPVETAFSAFERLDIEAEPDRRLTQGQLVRLPRPPYLKLNTVQNADASPLLTIFGPNGFTGLARCVEITDDEIVLAAERMFVDLENHHE